MIFISYKSEEIEIAAKIRVVLESNLYPCWMAPDSIPAGSNYLYEIPNAIRACDLFVLIISEASQRSQWIQKEIDRAVKYDRYIVPFHIDDSELIDAIDFVIANNQRIEAAHNFDQACQELLEIVKIHHPVVDELQEREEPIAPASEETRSDTDNENADAAGAVLSQDELLKLLETLPREYLEKLIPNVQASPTVTEAIPTPTPTPAPVPEPQPLVVPKTECPTPIVPQFRRDDVQEEVPDEVKRAARLAILQDMCARYEKQYEQVNPKGFRVQQNKLIGYKPHKKEGGNVVIPWGVEVIGQNVFAELESVRCVVLPSTVTTIEDYAFSNCVNLVKVVFHEGLLRIGNNAFLECSRLQNITLPKTLSQIGDYAFYNCSRAAFDLSAKIEYIGRAAFNNCKKIKIQSGNQTYKVLNHCIVDFSAQKIISAAADCQFPTVDTIVSVGDGAFRGSLALGFLTIPENIKYIGREAFAYCCTLQEVTVLGDMEAISYKAFSGCRELSVLDIQGSVARLDSQAFLNCQNLSQVKLNQRVSYLASDAFRGCPCKVKKV